MNCLLNELLIDRLTSCLSQWTYSCRSIRMRTIHTKTKTKQIQTKAILCQQTTEQTIVLHPPQTNKCKETNVAQVMVCFDWCSLQKSDHIIFESSECMSAHDGTSWRPSIPLNFSTRHRAEASIWVKTRLQLLWNSQIKQTKYELTKLRNQLSIYPANARTIPT